MQLGWCAIRRCVAAVALVFAAGTVQAIGPSLPSGVPNLFGIGIGSTTEYSGGKDRVVLGAPGLRYKTEGGRLLEWYGPYAQFNVLGDTGWQLGPAVNYKFGRKDVDDPVVASIHDIDSVLEGGFYGGYEYVESEGVPLKLRLSVTVLSSFGQTYDGARALVSGTYWQPLSRKFMVGVGVGAGWAPASFNQTYYGVTPADSASSGLPDYTPSSGLFQVLGWLGVIYAITPNWYAGAMILDQRLVDKAADSPIVTQRGKRDQITYGVGLGYAWD